MFWSNFSTYRNLPSLPPCGGKGRVLDPIQYNKMPHYFPWTKTEELILQSEREEQSGWTAYIMPGFSVHSEFSSLDAGFQEPLWKLVIDPPCEQKLCIDQSHRDERVAISVRFQSNQITLVKRMNSEQGCLVLNSSSAVTQLSNIGHTALFVFLHH